jgi:hypothetical protein
VLRQHCDAIDRPFNDIERTALGRINVCNDGTSARDAIEYCRRVSETGIQHLIVSLGRDYEITPIEVMGKEVIPALAEL